MSSFDFQELQLKELVTFKKGRVYFFRNQKVFEILNVIH